MKSEITDIAPYRKRITIEIPREEVDKAFEEVYGQLQDAVQIRGFRRGRVPKRILERRFAREAHRDVCAKLVDSSLTSVIKENKIAILARPDLDIEKLEVKPGEAFGFTTEVDVRPQFSLPAYKGLRLTRTAPPVTEEKIARALEGIREAFAEHEKIDGPASDEHYLNVDLQLMCEGDNIATRRNASIAVNTPKLFDVSDAAIAGHLRGLRAGEEKSFPLAFPSDYASEKLRGKTAEVKIKVNSVYKQQLPPLDDALAQRCGMENLASLRQLVIANLESARRSETQEIQVEEIRDILTSACSFEMPPEILQRMRERAAARLRWSIKKEGIADREIEALKSEIDRGAAEIAKKALQWMIISDAIADEEKIEITENDVQSHIVMLAEHYHTTPAQIWRRIQEMNGMAEVVANIRETKIIKCILDHAILPNEETANSPPAVEEGKASELEKPANVEENTNAASS